MLGAKLKFENMNIYKNKLRVYFAAIFAIITLLFANYACAAMTFPELTGRVVDQANILDTQTKESLDVKLAQIEKESSDQIVVVTLSSLQGYDISEYGYQLGRYWGIGQKKLNNGVLLIVAPNEHKVRIEVGYGLEGTLNDILSDDIIRKTIVPQFKAGNMQQGIVDGVNAIDEVLKLNPEERADRASKAQAQSVQQNDTSKDNFNTVGIIFFVIIVILFMINSRRRVSNYNHYNGFDIALMIINGIAQGLNDRDHRDGGGFGGGSFGGGDGGSFGGGGGSFGGGGASGDW